ncbi:YHS domain-containing (seleno)protein [Tenacibaculum sp. 190524A02b]|uniref:YHS domain-containing protein n=1 Tax=Tenacibaculum vairaonense TaxID=3137860 RepID=A0ABM9PQ28_9FLAO
MRKLLFILLFITSTAFSQNNYNTKKGAVANGYDVVAYFNNEAKKGTKKHSTVYDNVTFRFSSKKNLTTFKEAPEKYIPQYGGYCAYAIGKNGKKVGIDPKTFEIRDNKLYLFYNSWGTNTLKLWLKEQPETLRKQADKNWILIRQ